MTDNPGHQSRTSGPDRGITVKSSFGLLFVVENTDQMSASTIVVVGNPRIQYFIFSIPEKLEVGFIQYIFYPFDI